MTTSSIGHQLTLAPLAASSPDKTHAALVVSQASFTDVTFGATFSTVEQLRTSSPPNPWESAWAIFGYTDNAHFYYVAFKPNGWELGKVDPAYPGGQRFLATGSDYPSLVGTTHTFNIVQEDNTISVFLDGILLTKFTDTERPYLTGSVGFYTEDAKVTFDNVTGSITDNFDQYPTTSVSDGDVIGSNWRVVFTGYGSVTIDESALGGESVNDVFGSSRAETLRGGASSDYLHGLGGNDSLFGGAGNDFVDGGRGADKLSGGSGADTFVFATAIEARSDSIRDWERVDFFDVRGIDADLRSTSDNAFTFVGSANFSAAGQLRYIQDARLGVTYIEGNIDDALQADFRITVLGLHQFLDANFLL